MDNILVIFTGGTIGSKIDGDTINVDSAVNRVIINSFLQEYPDCQVNFDLLQPMNMLSENITPIHWQQLFKCLKEVDFAKYKGVIITHGSDTISYTSAFISFMFANTPIPIVLTCSNYVLGHELSNGQENFNNSVFLCLNGVKGVFSVFQNSQRQNIVFLASRMQEADPYNDQFTSCGGVAFGEIIQGKLCPFEDKINPNLSQLKNAAKREIVSDITFENQVAAIKSYPGQNFNNYCFSPKTKAVLCNLYHSSSNCVEQNEYNMTDFIAGCKKKGIDVYLMSFKKTTGEQYQTTKLIVGSGGIPLVNISFESAYVKLNIAYNQSVMPPKSYMDENIFFEKVFDTNS